MRLISTGFEKFVGMALPDANYNNSGADTPGVMTPYGSAAVQSEVIPFIDSNSIIKDMGYLDSFEVRDSSLVQHSYSSDTKSVIKTFKNYYPISKGYKNRGAVWTFPSGQTSNPDLRSKCLALVLDGTATELANGFAATYLTRIAGHFDNTYGTGVDGTDTLDEDGLRNAFTLGHINLTASTTGDAYICSFDALNRQLAIFHVVSGVKNLVARKGVRASIWDVPRAGTPQERHVWVRIGINASGVIEFGLNSTVVSYDTTTGTTALPLAGDVVLSSLPTPRVSTVTPGGNYPAVIDELTITNYVAGDGVVGFQPRQRYFSVASEAEDHFDFSKKGFEAINRSNRQQINTKRPVEALGDSLGNPNNSATDAIEYDTLMRPTVVGSETGYVIPPYAPNFTSVNIPKGHGLLFSGMGSTDVKDGYVGPIDQNIGSHERIQCENSSQLSFDGTSSFTICIKTLLHSGFAASNTVSPIFCRASNLSGYKRGLKLCIDASGNLEWELSPDGTTEISTSVADPGRYKEVYIFAWFDHIAQELGLEVRDRDGLTSGPSTVAYTNGVIYEDAGSITELFGEPGSNRPAAGLVRQMIVCNKALDSSERASIANFGNNKKYESFTGPVLISLGVTDFFDFEKHTDIGYNKHGTARFVAQYQKDFNYAIRFYVRYNSSAPTGGINWAQGYTTAVDLGSVVDSDARSLNFASEKIKDCLKALVAGTAWSTWIDENVFLTELTSGDYADNQAYLDNFVSLVYNMDGLEIHTTMVLDSVRNGYGIPLQILGHKEQSLYKSSRGLRFGETYNTGDNKHGLGYIRTPYSTAFDLGTSDFTIEFYIQRTYGLHGSDGVLSSSTPLNPYGHDYVDILSNRNGTSTSGWEIGIERRSNVGFQGLYIALFSGASITISTGGDFENDFPLGVKVHVAIERFSGTVTIYLNGVAKASGAYTSNNVRGASGHGFNIGTYEGPTPGSHSAFLQAILSDVNIVVGEALYQGNFTPPQGHTPPTTASNQKLLLPFNGGWKDFSPSNHAFTPAWHGAGGEDQIYVEHCSIERFLNIYSTPNESAIKLKLDSIFLQGAVGSSVLAYTLKTQVSGLVLGYNVTARTKVGVISTSAIHLERNTIDTNLEIEHKFTDGNTDAANVLTGDEIFSKYFTHDTLTKGGNPIILEDIDSLRVICRSK